MTDEQTPSIDPAENLAIGNAENLYTALCIYLGIPIEKTEPTLIMTAIAALEYAATIAKVSGLSRETFDETVSNAWKAAQGEASSSIVIAKNLDSIKKK
tara:strand:- start:851 stop:1147 length:297 start_codon:yes stop_codon:yes gene_type:complete